MHPSPPSSPPYHFWSPGKQGPTRLTSPEHSNQAHFHPEPNKASSQGTRQRTKHRAKHQGKGQSTRHKAKHQTKASSQTDRSKQSSGQASKAPVEGTTFKTCSAFAGMPYIFPSGETTPPATATVSIQVLSALVAECTSG